MKTWLKWIAVTATAAALATLAPSTAHAAPYCGITWGSLAKSADARFSDPLFDVRAGQHPCYDRLVMDVDGPPPGYSVFYHSGQGIGTEGGVVIPLRGEATLNIVVYTPTHDANGVPRYSPTNPTELVDVTCWRTFRQAALGDSYDGFTNIGLGVRARLPFRVFTLAGPGDNSRVVIDVAHQW